MRREVIGCPDCGAPAHANVCEETRSRDALIKRLETENEAIKATQAKIAADYAACFAENERLRALLEDVAGRMERGTRRGDGTVTVKANRLIADIRTALKVTP
jgi:hypothetical protein